MAVRLHRKIKAVRKVIATNKDLPEQGTPPPAESSAGQENQLHQYWTAHPFKTATELKSEVAGGSNISVRTIQTVCQRRLGMPSHCTAKKPLLTEKMLRK
jgi:hypothetical protein